MWQSLFSRLPGTLRKTGINASRTGLRNALETLAKGCHKLWVTRHAAKKVDRSQESAPVGESEGDSVATILSWVDEDDDEVEQTRSVDDNFTPEQDEQDNLDSKGEHTSPTAALDPKGESTRQIHKHRITTDYIQ